MILCDTNIFIEAFKNNPSATETLRGIGFQNISLSAVTLMELYFGAFNKRELAKIKSRMKHLETLVLDRSITNAAINLIEQYSKSQGIFRVVENFRDNIRKDVIFKGVKW
jgi:tRNA(fMet)-specific endonuclease VapC